MKEIVQHNHSVGIGLVEVGTQKTLQLSLLGMYQFPNLQYPDYNSGFLAEVSQMRGEEVVIR